MRTYEEFLDSKTHSDNRYGFTVENLPDFLFDFQRELVAWALAKGRAAIFADCGLGNAWMERQYPGYTGTRTDCPGDFRFRELRPKIKAPVPECGVLGGDEPWL